MISEAPLADVAANLKRGIEYVGGRLTILPDRLVFRSHALNLQTGATEVPLRDVSEVRRTNSMFVLPNRLEVVMRTGVRFVFIVWGRDRLADLVEAQRSRVV